MRSKHEPDELCPWCAQPVRYDIDRRLGAADTDPPEPSSLCFGCCNEDCPVQPRTPYFDTIEEVDAAWARTPAAPPPVEASGERLRIWGERSASAGPLSLLSVEELHREVARARAKFPGNGHALTALVEEVGELAKALLQRAGDGAVKGEALQVACVAMCIYEEGDATFCNLTDEESQP